MPPGWTGLSWYTSERNPTLNIDSGSSGVDFAAISRLAFGGVGPLGGFGVFSFFALEGLLRSGSDLESVSADFGCIAVSEGVSIVSQAMNSITDGLQYLNDSNLRQCCTYI